VTDTELLLERRPFLQPLLDRTNVLIERHRLSRNEALQRAVEEMRAELEFRT
jgi:hypothetical protein